MIEITLSEAALARACETVRVIAHPDRLRICAALLADRTPVTKLAARLGLRQAAVSQHLHQLRAHNIVRPEREGRRVFYRVIHPAPAWLLDCIHQHADDALNDNPLDELAEQPLEVGG